MFLPKSKYTVSPAGLDEYTFNRQPYHGPVLTTYKGETYAGTSPGTVQGKVEKVRSEGTYLDRKAVAGRRIPTEEEYRQGRMTRYFQQELRTMKIIEILPEDWERRDLETVNYRYYSSPWILTGSLDDIIIQEGFSRYSVEGVRKKNQKYIFQAEAALPGISSSKVLFNPEEFVRSK